MGVLTRPQASLADFYRELGHLFSVPLSPHNRWASAKVLREKWLHHIDSLPLSARAPDRRSPGNEPAGLRRAAPARPVPTWTPAPSSPSSWPAISRLASRLEEPNSCPLPAASAAACAPNPAAPQLLECLNHLLKMAGNPKLLSPLAPETLCEHAAGNLRLLMNMANDLLAAACHQEREHIDEKLFFEVFALDPKPTDKS